jgi:hypothetical protein
MLDSVEDGNYTLVTGNSCEDAPVIISGNYYQHVMTNTSFSSQMLSLMAGPIFDYPNNYLGDSVWDTVNYATGREIWTNTAVMLILN